MKSDRPNPTQDRRAHHRSGSAGRALAALAMAVAAASPARPQGVPPPPGADSPAFEKAAADFRAGRFAECQRDFAGVASAPGRAGLSARAAYAAACCAAQRGAAVEAFNELNLALANGFRD